MNLGSKQDIDELLARWPAPSRAKGAQDEDQAWEESAEAIMKAAVESKGEAPSDGTLAALLEAPELAPEPGEGEAAVVIAEAAAGEKKMPEEQEKERSEPPVSIVTPIPSERKRPSLKEIAARASQSGARLSSPGVSTPSPSSVGSTLSRASTSTPLPRPVEASKDDSGVIHLDTVRASVTPQQAAAADKAKPATVGLFDDDKADVANDVPATPAAKAAAIAAAPPSKRSNAGAIAGLAIAAIGVAAAFAIVGSRKPLPEPVATTEHAASPSVTASPTPVATVAPVAAATAQVTATPASDATGAPADPAKVAAAPVNGVAGPKDAPASASGPVVGKVPGPMPTGAGAVATAAPAPGKPGDLQSEMARAVGKDSAPVAKAEPAGPVPEPASGPKNQNVPDRPSQGAVAAAVNAVIGGAKACVSGADDVSRANITFSSSGTVSSVSVSGWAASHGKSGCVQAALKAAKTGPFSSASYSVGIPIRP